MRATVTFSITSEVDLGNISDDEIEACVAVEIALKELTENYKSVEQIVGDMNAEVDYYAK